MPDLRRVGLISLSALLLTGATLKVVTGRVPTLHAIAVVLELLAGLAILFPGTTHRIGLAGATLLFMSFSSFHGTNVISGHAGASCSCFGPVAQTSHAWALILCGLGLSLAVALRGTCTRPAGAWRLEHPAAWAAAFLGGIAVALMSAPPPPAPMKLVEWSKLVPVTTPGLRGAPALQGVAPSVHAAQDSPPVRQPAQIGVRALSQSTQVPIAGVRVWWNHDATSSTGAAKTSVLLPDGVGHIALPESGGLLVGRDPGGTWASCDVPAGSTEVALEFPDQVVLSGTVHKRNGAPFPDVALIISGRGGESPARTSAPTPEFRMRAERLRIVTDTEGRFEVRGLTSKSVRILPEDPALELARPGNLAVARGLYVPLPARGVVVTLFPGRRAVLHFRDDLTGLPLAPPVRLSLDPLPIGLNENCLIFDGQRSSAELIWPVDGVLEADVALSCESPGYERAIISLNTSALLGDHPITVHLRRSAEARGSLRLRIPGEWRYAPNVLRLALQARGGEKPITCKVVQVGGEWIVPDVPPGHYDVMLAGVRLLSGVRVVADDVQALDVPLSADLVSIAVRPTYYGSQVSGEFGFTVATPSLGVWGGRGEVTASGVIPLGLYPSGDKLIVNVSREGEVSAPTVILARSNAPATITVEVPLLERLRMEDIPSELR